MKTSKEQNTSLVDFIPWFVLCFTFVTEEDSEGSAWLSACRGQTTLLYNGHWSAVKYWAHAYIDR